MFPPFVPPHQYYSRGFPVRGRVAAQRLALLPWGEGRRTPAGSYRRRSPAAGRLNSTKVREWAKAGHRGEAQRTRAGGIGGQVQAAPGQQGPAAFPGGCVMLPRSCAC
jgi:hypothetical protein